MFYTSNYLWQLIRKNTTDGRNHDECNAYEALLYGFFSITFLPIIATLYIFDVIFCMLSTYILPLLGIMIMLFVGFPLLKLLQYLYLFVLFSKTAFNEYLVHWKNVSFQRPYMVSTLEVKSAGEPKHFGDAQVLDENSLMVLEK